MADQATVTAILAELPDQAATLGIDSSLVGSLLDSGLTDTKTRLAVWRTFAGKVSTLTDVSESGSSRSNSAFFDRAKQMIDYWQLRSDAEDTQTGVIPVRAHASVSNIKRYVPS